MGRRIVLTTYGTLGDLHPYLAIALELRARGHRPVIATSEYHRGRAEGAGVEFHPIRPDISFDDQELHRRLTEPRRGLQRVIRELMLPALRSTYEDLTTLVKRDGGADLIVSQILVFAAPLVAEKSGIRWVSTELQPGAFMSAHDPPVLAPLPALSRLRSLGPRFHRALFGVARLAAARWGKPVRRLRQELGLPRAGDPLFEGRYSPDLVLALFSRVIGPPQTDWPPKTLVTGFPFYDERATHLPSDLAELLDHGEPPIVFTLGSSAVWDAGADRFYSESIAAAQKLGRRAVLLAGRNRLPRPLPRNVMAVDYAPYARLFPSASVIVHHGGIGTTGQALRAGRPMLVMPFGGDQYDNGARVARLGVGRTIMRKDYVAERVAGELRVLLEDRGCWQTAMELGQRVQAEDGVRAACDAICTI